MPQPHTFDELRVKQARRTHLLLLFIVRRVLLIALTLVFLFLLALHVVVFALILETLPALNIFEHVVGRLREERSIVREWVSSRLYRPRINLMLIQFTLVKLIKFG